MVKISKILVFLLCIVLNFAFFVKTPKFSFAKNQEINFSSMRGMCVMETQSKRVLNQKSLHEKMPMASTTKIITALSILSRCDDLDKVVCIPKEATKIPGTSIYLEEGEHLTVRELLYGLMLRSGNDASMALAISVFGSVQNFLDYTNEFVKSLGANDTHLANSHGLDNQKHFTTPYDLALLASIALKNPEFAKIVKTKETTISKEFAKNKNEKRLLKNKNKLLKNYENADGVKTGYTGKAGRCFVGSATKNGMQVVCVVLNCKPMFEQTEALLDNAFDTYRMVEILKPNQTAGQVKVDGDDNINNVDCYVKGGFSYPLANGEINDIKITTKLDSEINAPFKKDTICGEINVTLGKHLIFCGKTYTIKEAEGDSFKNNFYKIVKDFC